MNSGKATKELSPLDLAVLRHVFQYRMTIEPVVKKLFFANRDVGGPGENHALDALGRLTHHDLLRFHNARNYQAMGGKTNYWTITRAGAAAIGVPKKKKKNRYEPGNQFRYVPCLWFCCLGHERRYLAEHEDLQVLFGDDAPHRLILHCLTAEKDGPRLLRLLPSTQEAEVMVAELRAIIQEMPTLKPVQYEWVRSRDYGFALLGESPEKCARLTTELRRKKPGPPLEELCHVIVEFAPNETTVTEAIASLGGGK